jgi:hypothetical protein
LPSSKYISLQLVSFGALFILLQCELFNQLQQLADINHWPANTEATFIEVEKTLDVSSHEPVTKSTQLASELAIHPETARPQERVSDFSLMPSEENKYLLCQSWLTLKRMFNKERIVVLCCPQTVQDVQHCFETFFTNDPTRPLDERHIPLLGNIAYAATKGTPLLIILPYERFGTEQPSFYPLDTLVSISDEVALRQACHFQLEMQDTELRFACKTSTDYQTWMHFLTIAFEMVAQNYTDKDVKRKTRYLEMVEFIEEEQQQQTLARSVFSNLIHNSPVPNEGVHSVPLSESPTLDRVSQ